MTGPRLLRVERVRWSRLGVATLILLNGATLLGLTRLGGDEKLYIRNTLFGTVVDDRQVADEASLNRWLAKSWQRDRDPRAVRSLFTPRELQALDRWVIQGRQAPEDCRQPGELTQTLTAADCLARRLAEDISPYLMGGKCGLDGSLRSRIGQLRQGIGCCSDYNDGFLLRAMAVGLEAREVHNLGHTTAEYWDPAQQRWKWIDTSNRVQISDRQGRLLSAYQIRSRFPWSGLRAIDLPPRASTLSQVEAFGGYRNTSNAILYWTQGTNLQAQEQFEERLRRWGLSKDLTQILSKVAGIRPGFLVLAPNEVAFRFRVSQMLIQLGLLTYLLLNLVLLLGTVGWRVRRVS